MHDNLVFQANGNTAERLQAALSLASHNTILGFTATPEGLKLHSFTPSNDPEFSKLPAPMHAPDLLGIVQAWLASARYPNQPDHDGDSKKGWMVTLEHASWHPTLTIRPTWLIYGK